MSFEHPVGRKNRKKIIMVLRSCDELTANQIKAHIDNDAKKHIELFLGIKNSKCEEAFKKETMSYRAILSNLSLLINQGFILHRGFKYSIRKINWYDFPETEVRSDHTNNSWTSGESSILKYFGNFRGVE